ncbi:terpenoid synthase [Marasmius fiardii PR-910]|nr:terpenoid synthase [Marasmius fiardii PR-910]
MRRVTPGSRFCVYIFRRCRNENLLYFQKYCPPPNAAPFLRAKVHVEQGRKYSTVAAQVTSHNPPLTQHRHLPTRPKLQHIQSAPLPPKPPPKPSHRDIDIQNPIVTLQPQLQQIRSNLLTLLGSAHSSFNDLLNSTNYFPLTNQRKMLRVLVVFLWAKAVNGKSTGWEAKLRESSSRGGEALTCAGVLNDPNPNTPDHRESFEQVFPLRPPHPISSYLEENSLSENGGILPTQLRLAQIIEMIHTAGGLHDMVASAGPSFLYTSAVETTNSHSSFNNKLVILGGDFLLGRASHALSRLGDAEVVELIASAISNRVEGKMWGMEKLTSRSFSALQPAWISYMRKIYLSTACLFAKGARASVVLAGCKEGQKDAIWREAAYTFGRHFGIANELSEEISRFECSKNSPSPIISAPVLFTWEAHPDIVTPMMQRGLTDEGDVAAINHLIRTSEALDRTRNLVRFHADQARQSLSYLPDRGDGREGLELLIHNLLERVDTGVD